MVTQSSAADDIIVDGNSILNLADNKKVDMPAAEANCEMSVRQQGVSSSKDAVQLVNACADYLEIKSLNTVTSSVASDVKTAEISVRKNGGVSQMWHNVRANSESVYLVQMADMSLHMLQGMPDQKLVSVMWTRQEGLSAIKQMEVLE